MPYTSPSQQSPASTATNSPAASRSNSVYGNGVITTNNNTAASGSHQTLLPRSLSSKDFMYKHRRSPSYSKEDSFTSVDEATEHNKQITGHSPKQAFACAEPLTKGTFLPTPATEPNPKERRRKKERPSFRLDNLAELEEALRLTLSTRRVVSPNEDENGTHSQMADLARQALSEQVRKFSSHSRSSSEVTLNSKAFQTPSASSSAATSDSDDEEDLALKPPLVRKKSGELVKPALRLPAHRRPSSLPGTPTFGKAVHFNEDIEQVRHFLQVDRPMAVSAGTSPVETYESESEFPFGDDEGGFSAALRIPGWDIRLPNFPQDSYERQTMPVRLERLFLSTDQKSLIGAVAVANLCYHKLVMARFTFDYWKTTSEVAAEYTNDVRMHSCSDNYDRFTFNIRLSEQTNLEKKTLLLCVRYNVNGHDYWDNNRSTNYQVGFAKKTDSSKQRSVVPVQRSSNAVIPRSRGSGAAQRPRSMPPSLDDEFAGSLSHDFQFRQTRTNLTLSTQPQQPKIRFKNAAQTSSDRSRESDGSGVASKGLSTRYSFGASLSAALSNAQTALGDRSGVDLRNGNNKANFGYFGQTDGSTTFVSATGGSAKPVGLATEKPDLKSVEYNELIQKYCFFGSAKNEKHHPAVLTTVALAAEKKAASPPAAETDEKEDPSAKSNALLEPLPMADEEAEPDSPASQTDGADDRQESSSQCNIFSCPKASSVQSSTSAGSSRAQSPVSFGFLHRQNMHGGGIFGEPQAPQAILS